MERMLIRLALHTIRFAGAATAAWGIAYTVNAATRAGGYVTIRVTSTLEAVSRSPLSGVNLPAGVVLNDRDLPLDVADSTVAEQVLSRGDVLLSGLCAGVAALLLIALLNSLTQGRPFARRNPARIAWLAALALVGGLSPLLPGAAAATVLDRVGLTGPFLPSPTLSWPPLAAAALLFAMALAFRAGAKTLATAGPASPTDSQNSS
ncbi:hypothetical protein ACIBP6_22805 [Nonomuraea terrae]|uniref:hypothetical protein n=1 Tax=Nonomuraea terrae TaxID=2530383 RepID=UPI0037A5EC1C